MPTFTRDGATIHYFYTQAPGGRPQAPTVFFGRTNLAAAWPTGVAPKTAMASAVTAMIVLSFVLNIV